MCFLSRLPDVYLTCELFEDELNAEVKKLNGIYKEYENLNKLLY